MIASPLLPHSSLPVICDCGVENGTRQVLYGDSGRRATEPEGAFLEGLQPVQIVQHLDKRCEKIDQLISESTLQTLQRGEIEFNKKATLIYVTVPKQKSVPAPRTPSTRDSIFKDVVFPVELVGKRTNIKLDKNQQFIIEFLPTFVGR